MEAEAMDCVSVNLFSSRFFGVNFVSIIRFKFNHSTFQIKLVGLLTNAASTNSVLTEANIKHQVNTSLSDEF